VAVILHFARGSLLITIVSIVKEGFVTFKAVEGTDKGDIVLYTLSTCMWCRMAKDLLKDLGVAYRYVDVDLLEAAEKESARQEIRKWNPKGSYPTIIIDGRTSISGFDETEIKEKIL
jgi:glutaredoxin-like protein NrdH